jgi:hypothetical protein
LLVVRLGAAKPAIMSGPRDDRHRCRCALATRVIRDMARSEPSADERFPAISVRQPAADLIVRGAMHRDRRTRPTRFRGWMLVHASQAVRREDVARHRAALGLERDETYEPERGKLVGIAWLEDCIADGREWTYVWSKPKRFRVAVPCRGHYSIPFYVPATLVRGTPAEKVKAGKLVPADPSA